MALARECIESLIFITAQIEKLLVEINLFILYRYTHNLSTFKKSPIIILFMCAQDNSELSELQLILYCVSDSVCVCVCVFEETVLMTLLLECDHVKHLGLL